MFSTSARCFIYLPVPSLCTSVKLLVQETTSGFRYFNSGHDECIQIAYHSKINTISP